MGAAPQVLVPPGEPLAGVEIFAAGPVQAGNDPAPGVWTAALLGQMVTNFVALAKRARPIFVPKVKVGHRAAPEALDWDGLPAYGEVDALTVEEGPDGITRLVADLVKVPPLVKAWVRAGLYSEVSPEIDDEAADPSLVAVAAREGIALSGPVLKAVSFLGAAPPANKDILGLKSAVFSGRRAGRIRHTRSAVVRGRRRYFAEVTTMDPTTLDLPGKIAWLKEQGMDTAPLEAIPDAAMQQAAVDAVVALLWPVLQAQQQQQQAATTTTASQTPAPADARTPSQVTLKYTEAETKALVEQIRTAVLASLKPTLDGATQTLEQTRQFAERQARERHHQDAREFAGRLVREGRLAPADVECDQAGDPLPHTELFAGLCASPVRTLTFSEGGKTVSRSEYDVWKARLEKREPRKFGERVAQTTPGKVSVLVKVREDALAQRARQAAAQEIPLERRLGMLPGPAAR